MERTFYGCESSMEQVLGTFCSAGANVSRNESSAGVKVLPKGQDYTIGTPAKCNLDCCNVCKNATISDIRG